MSVKNYEQYINDLPIGNYTVEVVAVSESNRTTSEISTTAMEITIDPDFKAYIDATFVDTVKYGLDQTAIQAQLDKSITTWFYDVEPTLLNVPASDWDTDEKKNVHLGDLYYDNITGFGYRFRLVSTVYSWVVITDSGITLALSNASKAQDTADSKRRVFVSTPVAPYDIGDLWDSVTGIQRCKITKAKNASFAAADWYLISDVTDYTNTDIANSEINLDHLGIGNVENKSSAEIRAELTATEIKTGAGWDNLPYSGATVNTGLFANLAGKMTSGNISTYFGADAITASIIDVTDFYARSATVSGILTVGGGGANKYELTLDGSGAASPFKIFDTTPVSGGLVLGFDSEDRPWFRGGIGKDSIQSMEAFTPEVLAQIIPLVEGSSGGQAETTGLPVALHTSTVIMSKVITLASANSSSSTVSVSFADSGAVEDNSASPVYKLEIFRAGTTAAIYSKNYNGYSEQRSSGGPIYNFGIDVNLDFIDANHATANDSPLSYTVKINRLSGPVNAPSLSSCSMAQTIQGGGVAGAATTLGGKSGDYYLDYNNSTNKPTTMSGFGVSDYISADRRIDTGTGLSGGGTLWANRTLSISAAMIPATASELSSSDDLNNLCQGADAGFYYQSSNADAPGNNYPKGHSGSLIVQKSASTGGYGATQLYQTYHATTPELYFRSGYGTISSWRRVITNYNYIDYTVTKTGTGASGTWAISITGNSTYATNAGNADKLDGLHASEFGILAASNTWAGNQTFTSSSSYPLVLNRSVNTGGVGIKFTDNAAQSQYGFITYYHADSQSYGSGNAFVYSGDQPTMSHVFATGTNNNGLQVLTSGTFHDVYHAGNIPTWNQSTTGNAATVTAGLYTDNTEQTVSGLKTFDNLKIGNSNKIIFANGDYIRYDDTLNVYYFSMDGGDGNAIIQATTFQGALTGNATSASNADKLDNLDSTAFGLLGTSRAWTATQTFAESRHTTLKIGADGTRGYFFSDAANRTSFRDGIFYLQDTVPIFYNYAQTTYHGSASGSAQSFRASNLTGNNWGINPAGAYSGSSVSVTGSVSANDNMYLAASNGNGYCFWDSSAYRMYMASATGSDISELWSTADYNMYFEMTGTNRGFVWYNGSYSGTAQMQLNNGDLRVQGSVATNTYFKSTDDNVVLGTATAGTVFLRPQAYNSGTAQIAIDTANSGTMYGSGKEMFRYGQDNWLRVNQAGNFSSGTIVYGILSVTGLLSSSVRVEAPTVRVSNDTDTYMSVAGIYDDGKRVYSENNNVLINPTIDRIYAFGDTDTYTDFHAANSWRVVAGGVQRFSVSSSEVKTEVKLTVNSSFKVASTAEMDYGIHGGYGNSNSSGGAWGSNIWSMGTSYDGGHAGTSYTRPNYGICWLRSGLTAQGYNSYAGEGVYLASQNLIRAGIGHLGIWTTGTLRSNGSAYFPASFITSARRYKKIERVVSPFESLNKICAIGRKGVSVGTWKDPAKDKHTHRWLIAEDVEKEMPEVVTKNEKGQCENLNQTEMIADLCACVYALEQEMKSMQHNFNKQLSELTQ